MHQQQVKVQPKALYLLNFVSMWECFSYYGMRVLLILYMTQELEMSDAQAFGLYALYTTLVEFGGVIGGAVADRLVGLKRAIAYGGWTIALGHILMALPQSNFTFFLGLGAIVAGTAFFRANVPAFLGKFYEENDPRRDAGYTIYYTGINIGGFLAALSCGIVAELYGWHAGFGLAALGMLSGNIALAAGSRWLKADNVEEPRQTDALAKGLICTAMLALLTPLSALALYFYDFVLQYFALLLPLAAYYVYGSVRRCTKDEKRKLVVLLGLLCFLVLFYACEEQLGSSLVLFSERHADRTTFLGIIPSASLINFNPLTILILGPLLSCTLQKFALTTLQKIAIAFALLSAAFTVLFANCYEAEENAIIPLIFVIVSVMLISAGEIFIGPTIYAAASQAAPKALAGIAMSLVTIAYALANLLSGAISQTMAITDEAASISIYANAFYIIGLLAALLAASILILNKKIEVSESC